MIMSWKIFFQLYMKILYLRRGLPQAGGKLPLFDLDGQAMNPRLVRHCLAQGWAEPCSTIR